MKKFFILFLSFHFANASSTFEEQIKKLYPQWDVSAIAIGDLNKDGKEDAVAIQSIFANTKDDISEIKEITLRVFLNDGSGNLKLFVDAPKSVCTTCGGIAGPGTDFSLDYKNGTFRTTISGGARNRYSQTFIWRLQNNQFSLIGIDESSFDTFATEKGSVESKDSSINLSTLKMEEITQTLSKDRKNEEDEPVTQKAVKKCAAPASLKGIKLNNFDISTFEFPRCL